MLFHEIKINKRKVAGLASFCQSGKNQWQKPVITGMTKTLWQKWANHLAKNICTTNIICKINLKPIHDHSYSEKDCI